MYKEKCGRDEKQLGALAKYAKYERANVQQAPLIKFLWVFGATNAISFALMAAAAAADAAAAGVQLPVRFAGSNNAKYTAQQKRRKNTERKSAEKKKRLLNWIKTNTKYNKKEEAETRRNANIAEKYPNWRPSGSYVLYHEYHAPTIIYLTLSPSFSLSLSLCIAFSRHQI